ncbi:MAG: hypothetical protein AAFQ87_19390, partial [Bacteroidota bacterium]
MLLSTSLFSQIRSDLDIKKEPVTEFDKLLNEIRVPEIDPRQYIIIYEWSPSNERKSRDGIRDEYRMRSVARYQELYERELKRLQEQVVDLEIKEREVIARRRIVQDALDSLRALEDQSIVPDEEYRIIFRELDELDTLSNKINTQLPEIKETIEYIQQQQVENNYAADYIRWEYGTGRDSTKFNGRKPFDFFDDMGTDYAGTQESYEEYYNEVVWRNAGTPNWEPIWWLNQYPWPNMDYRNIDLIDQDYRDQHFALIPYQKYGVLDRKATLRIVFDKTQLARNENFKGSIGLDAFLYEGKSDGSQSGDPREIEINPYSVIGEERKTIGLLNRPAGELADNLIVLVKKANELKFQAEQFYRTQDGFFTISQDRLKTSNYFLATSKEIIGLIDHTPTPQINSSSEELTSDEVANKEHENIDEIRKKLNELIRVSDSKDYSTAIDNDPNFRTEAYDFLRSENVSRSDLDELKTVITTLQDSVQQVSTGDNFVDNFKDNINRLRAFREDLRPVTTYLDYFDAEVGNTRNAFLSLIGKDRIDFHYLVGRLKTEIDRIDTTLIGYSRRLIAERNSTLKGDSISDDSNSVIDQYSIVNQQLTTSLRQISTLLGRLVDIQGSPLSFAVRTLYHDHDTTSVELFDDYDYYGYGDPNDDLLDQLDALFYDNKNREQLRAYIAKKAGEILYQDLVFGTIDLDLADAGEGDVLFIRMYWDKEALQIEKQSLLDDDLSSSTSGTDKVVAAASPERDGVALYVAKFQLTDRGWHSKITENFMLVDRVGEDLLPSNYPLNTTRFAPTGGISLTWGLRNDRRVNKYVKFDPV